MSNSKFTFGPVPSRRLGRSFGIDLVPFKTCSYDCVYCQLGCTTNRTVERKEYVPVIEVLDEIKKRIGEVDADYITLSGSGEPTLNSGVKKLICGIKKLTPIPVAVLTNASLLSEKEVRDALTEADLVVPSLDAGREEIFRSINRPHASLCFDRMVEGIVSFRREFRGELWLEIMFIEGINSGDEEVRRFIPLIEKINPDRVHLNTVARPPAEEGIRQVPPNVMEGIKKILGHKAEVIVNYDREHEGISSSREEILSVLKRRPCTLSDLVSCTGLHRNEVLKYIAALKEEGVIIANSEGGETYYQTGGKTH